MTQRANHVLLMGLNGPVGMNASKAFMTVAMLLRTVYREEAYNSHMVLFDDDVRENLPRGSNDGGAGIISRGFESKDSK